MRLLTVGSVPLLPVSALKTDFFGHFYAFFAALNLHLGFFLVLIVFNWQLRSMFGSFSPGFGRPPSSCGRGYLEHSSSFPREVFQKQNVHVHAHAEGWGGTLTPSQL